MKTSLLFTFLLLSQINCFGQIPNGGFELWEKVQNYDKPLFWETNQDSVFTRIVRDTLSVEGKYSIKFIPSVVTSWQGGCSSYIMINIKLQQPIGNNKSLTFYAKSIPVPLSQDKSVVLSVLGELISQGNRLAKFRWETFDIMEDFTKIQIPITHPESDAISITIYGGAIDGPADNCLNSSISWVDDLRVSETEIINANLEIQPNVTNQLVFPNPSNGVIQISQTEHKFVKYQLTSIDGKLIENGVINGSTISFKNNPKGFFLLRLISESPYIEVSAIIILE